MKKWKDRPFVLVGVNSDSDVGRAKRAVKNNGLTWRSFQNEPPGAARAISDDWGVRGWPTIIVIDSDGKIRYRGHSGDDAAAVAGDLLDAMKGG